jgi:PAS domain-containing protein
MVTDISQRKHAENTLKNREAMLRAIFESTDSGIAVIDETGRISQMNNRFHHLFLPTDDPPLPEPCRYSEGTVVPIPLTFGNS